MQNFDYKIRTKAGETREGSIGAVNQDSAIKLLQQEGYSVISIREKGKYSFGNIVFFKKVKRRDLVIFSRQIALLMQARVPLIQALTAISRQLDDIFKAAIIEITEDVRSGQTLSKALEKHKYAFPDLYVNIIRLGEVSGTLEQSFNYLADFYERQYNLEKTLKGAMLYPIVVLIFFLTIAMAMTIFVIPNLASLLGEMGQELPLSTKILVGYNNLLIHYWWLMGIIAIGLFVGSVSFSQSQQGKSLIDRIKIKIPVIGEMLKKVYITRFAEGLSTMVKGGLPIVEGMEVVADSVGNEVYKKIFLAAAQKVKEGSTITSVFVESEYIPPIVAQMVNIGEKTGKLEVSLEFISSFYTKEIEAILNNLQSLLMPFIMVFLALMIGFFALSVLMPIYSIYNTM